MPSPFGEITFRKIDHQSTLGAYRRQDRAEGRQGRHGGFGLSRRARDYLPSDDEVEKLRPKE